MVQDRGGFPEKMFASNEMLADRLARIEEGLKRTIEDRELLQKLSLRLASLETSRTTTTSEHDVRTRVGSGIWQLIIAVIAAIGGYLAALFHSGGGPR